MKNRIITNSIRTIKKSFSRFIPLFIMSFLGVFVFSGLLSTKPDMMKTLDNFLDKHNIYDFEIISTGGLTNNDINELKKIEGLKEIEPNYSVDQVIKDSKKEKDYVLNISSLPNKINTLKIIKGRLPEKNNEIVIENNFINKTSYKIGDTIELNSKNLKEKSYKIVGTIESGLYFNNDKEKQDRGTTTIGTGTINYYSYILENNFDQNYYNSLYITVEDTKELNTNSNRYKKIIDDVFNKINSIKEKREQSRYEEIYETANEEIKKQEHKIQNELSKVNTELTNAKSKLDSSYNQLLTSKNNLNYFKNQLNNAKKELDNGLNKYNQTLNNLNITEDRIDPTIKSLEENINNLETLLKNIPNDTPEYTQTLKTIEELKEKQKGLNTLKATKKELDKGYNDYNQNMNNYKYSNNLYYSGLNEYNNGIKKYQSGLEEYNKAKKEAEIKIEDAKKELSKIEMPIWMINDRTNHVTYEEYINDVTSIQNLSKIFPLVFFSVAILVSLISMSRMVEEERVEIGTLKSLGFSDKSIMVKYLLFSSIATVLGGFIGGLTGTLFIPTLIFNIYGMLFNIPNFYMGLNLKILILSVIISVICICGTTIYTVIKVLKEKPSDLMRPKAPKKGKRILLERWKFFWKKISFSNKVTLRNLFRYKKRALVTIVGIVGCSALMLCGFGIRDAIVDIANMQYKNTFIYDAMLYGKKLNKKDDIYKQKNIKDMTEAQSINVEINKTSATIQVIDKNEINKVVNLVDINDKPIKLEKGKVIITDKFADLTNTKIGDTLELMDDNNKKYKFKVGNITKNYLMHFIYIDKETFEDKYHYEPNVIYLNTTKMTQEEKNNLTNKLMEHEDIYNIMFIETLLENADNMLKSLNKVVLIIIILSASLSFVVLYNLSNININERKREISTLKVLGFHDKEVDNYITKENLIFTIIGIIIGLIAGTILTTTVIKTVEIDMARFLHNISIYSYIYTAVITILFTIIVNVVTHFNLKKIDMIASLKSVD